MVEISFAFFQHCMALGKIENKAVHFGCGSPHLIIKQYSPSELL
jgi:hypothetical protein